MGAQAPKGHAAFETKPRKLLAGVKYLLDLLHLQLGVLLVKDIGGRGTRLRRGHATCDTNLLAVILTQVVATILQPIEITRERLTCKTR